MNVTPEHPPENPYRSPGAPSLRESGAGSAGGTGAGIRRIRWASTAALVGLSCSVGLALFSNIVGGVVFGRALLPGGGVPPVTSSGFDQLASVINALETAVWILTAVPFLVWFHRCYRNLAELYVTGTKYSSGWAVGGWFVPFLNLVRPYQVAREIWDASNPEVHAAEGSEGWLHKRSAGLVLTWWLLYLAPSVVLGLSGLVGSQPSMEMWRLGTWLLMVGNLINACAAATAMLLIRRLDARQAARSLRLQTIFAGHPLAHIAPDPVQPGPGITDGRSSPTS